MKAKIFAVLVLLNIAMSMLLSGVVVAQDGDNDRSEPTPTVLPDDFTTPVPETLHGNDVPLPSFGVINISDQTYIVGEAISIVLPQALPLDYVFNYDLSTPKGFEFDAETRTISGLPSDIGTWDDVVYRAYNNNGDSAILYFSISIVEQNTIVTSAGETTGIVNEPVTENTVASTPTTKDRLTDSAKDAVDETADLIDNALQGKVSPIHIDGESNDLTMIVVGIIIGVIVIFILLNMLTGMLKGINN